MPFLNWQQRDTPSLIHSLPFSLVQDRALIKMAEVVTTYNGKSLKDVPAESFIKAFSAYLKSTGKVRIGGDTGVVGWRESRSAESDERAFDFD